MGAALPGRGHHSPIRTGPLPRTGFARILNADGLPAELRASYYCWILGGMLGLLAGSMGLFAMVGFAGMLAALGVGGLAAPGFAAAALTLAVSALQVLFAMGLKERSARARLALTVLAAATLGLALWSSTALSVAMAVGMASPAAGWAGFLLAAAATVLMWLENPSRWLGG
ncbi:hypothetical protein GCM10023081_31810 [Arthrobacter ginkgonis]|uniref:HdeD family acid-resistance protein n=1 Tax=Arthrobacter ginkgonis TaxID=1630594 RepID=A0ABP7CMY4_9MICC